MDNNTFAHVCWCKEDLEQALTESDMPNTPENVEALFCLLSENELAGRMIQAGWEYIYGKVSEIEGSEA